MVQPFLKVREKPIGYYQVIETNDDEYEETYRMTKFCSGCILNDRWVLTAGHCLDRKHEGAFTDFICSGSSFINCKNGTLHKIEKRIIHPDYKEVFNKTINDIGLLRVKNPFVYSERVQRIALATYQPSIFTRATVTGWGVSEVI
ncbi:chymotrypsin-1-like [Lycorma delicatula]|uniref:chymotrypsin-1-like n=1 Tax=Lycorma delicatula TaxID=130591 RepID=UPI003F51374C